MRGYARPKKLGGRSYFWLKIFKCYFLGFLFIEQLTS